MFFNKVSQKEITKSKNDGNLDLFEKLCDKYAKQHKSSKCKRFYNWLVQHSTIIGLLLSFVSIVISIGAFITSIIAIIK